MTHREWKAEVEKQLTLRDMTRKELASRIGKSYPRVVAVIAGTARSRIMTAQISEELGIEPFSE